MTTFNRAEARIDLDRITANVVHLKNIAGVDLMAVVKADAYGHGLVPVARAALAGGLPHSESHSWKKQSHFAMLGSPHLSLPGSCHQDQISTSQLSAILIWLLHQ